MRKKVAVGFIFMMVLFIFNVTSYAQTYSVYDTRAKSTVDSFVTITRPSGDETTFNKSYVICGVTNKKNVTVKLLRYDKNSEKYIDFKNVDSESSWVIGSSGVFMKEINIPYMGANKIRMVCYKDGDESKRQISNYTITVLKESFKSLIRKGFTNFSDAIKYIFH
jgi:hypothetical protein